MQLTAQQHQTVAALIVDGYAQYAQASTNLSMYNILYSIVDCKITIGDTKIYRDLKRCIKHHLESIEEQDFGYDLVSVEPLVNFSKNLPLLEQQAILKVFIRALDEHGYEEEKLQIASLLKVVNISINYSSRWSFINPLYYASVISVKHPVFIIAIILIVLFAEAIFLLPTSSQSLQLFEFTPHKYTNNIDIDTLISVPVMLLSVDDDIKVKPLTLFGALIIIVAKGFFTIFVLGFLVKKIEEKSKI